MTLFWLRPDDPAAASDPEAAPSAVGAAKTDPIRETSRSCELGGGDWAMTTEVLQSDKQSAVGVHGFYQVELKQAEDARSPTCNVELSVTKLGYGKTRSGSKEGLRRVAQSGSGQLHWDEAEEQWYGHFEVSADGKAARYAISAIKGSEGIVGVWRNVGNEWSRSKMSGRLSMWRGPQEFESDRHLASDACVWSCLAICHLVPDGRGKADLPRCATACDGNATLKKECAF
ncbi:MAG: hypothetical protein U0168_03925 [Nannocystaceae bacterium]